MTRQICQWFLSSPVQLYIHTDAWVHLKDTDRQPWEDPVQYPDWHPLIPCRCICKHKVKKNKNRKEISTLWENSMLSLLIQGKSWTPDLIINSNTSHLILGISTLWASFSWNFEIDIVNNNTNVHTFIFLLLCYSSEGCGHPSEGPMDCTILMAFFSSRFGFMMEPLRCFW